MKKYDKRHTDATREKARRLLSTAHILIAVVALIECLLLISFTTYSWIETASSLVIFNGPKTVSQTDKVNLSIDDALDYQFTVGGSYNDTNAADLNNFFNSVEYYRFAKTSSPDGKTFYFKKPTSGNYANGSTAGSSSYRTGDTTDINTSYTYFDFVVNNAGTNGSTYAGGGSVIKLQFQFDGADVFSVTPGTSGLNGDQCNDIRDAMRLSFQTGTGGAKIYSMEATPAAYTATNGASVTANTITDSGKVFTVARGYTQKVSCRIWFEENAPSLSGSGITDTQLAGVDINVNLKLKYVSNQFDYLYFDDYTFSPDQANLGGHLTNSFTDDTVVPNVAYTEENNYRVYFVYSTDGSNYKYYPMTYDSSDSDCRRWVSCDKNGAPEATLYDTQYQNITQSGSYTSSNAYLYSYFAYGQFDLANYTYSGNETRSYTGTPTALYTWSLSAAGNTDYELIYNAYSVTEAAAATGSSPSSWVKCGAGGWAYNTPLTPVYFRDRAIAITDNGYNDDGYGFITDAVNTAADTDAGSTRKNVMYVNTISTAAINTSNTTTIKTNASNTATLYYDKALGLFKSFVPTSWVSGPMYFRYCPSGKYFNSDVFWTASSPAINAGSSDYIYTALGYTEDRTISYYNGTVASYATGSGLWGEVEAEPIHFSTELIEGNINPAYRYQIGVEIGSSGSYTYYAMAAESDHLGYWAYLPVITDANDKICFRSYANNSNGSVNAQWVTLIRGRSDTYYAVTFASGADSSYNRGYWYVGVVVDGTVENLMYDADSGTVLGTLQFSVDDGTTWTNMTMIDHYRWYAPITATDVTTVLYRWTPYTGTEFNYSHDIDDGVFYLITEAPQT